MADFPISFYNAGVKGLLFILCMTYIANASGDNDIHNGNKDNAANSVQHTIFCNGTWCVMNEQYCDKSANKCLGCVYKKPECTPHLDCLQYCIDKGVEQAILENPDTAKEENSTPAWALPSFVVFLLLFLVSCVGHIVVFLLWLRQRQQDPKAVRKTPEETHLTDEKENEDATEPKSTETFPTPIQEVTLKSNEESHEFKK